MSGSRGCFHCRVMGWRAASVTSMARMILGVSLAWMRRSGGGVEAGEDAVQVGRAVLLGAGAEFGAERLVAWGAGKRPSSSARR